jgi:hypothetical protein
MNKIPTEPILNFSKERPIELNADFETDMTIFLSRILTVMLSPPVGPPLFAGHSLRSTQP